MPPRILVAGIGNIFLGDDAFGVEVVQRLAERTVARERSGHRFRHPRFRPHDGAARGSRPRDPGRRGPAGRRPGTLYVIEPEPDGKRRAADRSAMLDPHSLDPVKVLRLVKTMGGHPGRVLVVGCEPEIVGSDEDWDVTPGLSEPVQRAVDEAVDLIESLDRRRLGNRSPAGL